MRTLTATCLLITAFVGAVRAAAPLSTAPALPPVEDWDKEEVRLTAEQLLAAHAPELVIVPSLRGVIFIADPSDAETPAPADFSGIDVSRVTLFRQHPGAEEHVKVFLGQPASLPSLGRLAMVARLSLRERGEHFAVAYVPPQDLTDGVVRVVVTRSRLDGAVAVEGAEHFADEQYRRALSLEAGAELDAASLNSATEALNQNPFRRVTAVVEPGVQSGTSRVVLRVLERRPWEVNVGYNNAGTPLTGEDRIAAGFTWGNAFGRGDVLGYSFGSDLEAKHTISHSGSYTTTFASGRALTGYGAWSRLESAMPAPLSQEGTTWQAGLRYAIPLRATRAGWTQSLSFSADFKYSDNTLEFATIPITDNITHIAQFGATYGVSFRALGGQNAISVSGFASPGGLTRYNESSAFEGSRPGAKADYVYGKLHLSHRRALPEGFWWVTSAEAQFASGALLGSEQLNGGGVYSVRGYGESTAFGDAGVVVNNELHAPGFPLFKGGDEVDLFAFADFASLDLRVDDESTDLRSVGLGVNYQWRRHVSLRASHGWQLKSLDFASEDARTHLSVNVSF